MTYKCRVSDIQQTSLSCIQFPCEKKGHSAPLSEWGKLFKNRRVVDITISNYTPFYSVYLIMGQRRKANLNQTGFSSRDPLATKARVVDKATGLSE